MFWGWGIATVATALFWTVAIGAHWPLLAVALQLGSTVSYLEAAPWFPRYWDSTDARSVQLSVMLCLSMNACVILLGWMLSYIV